MMPTPPVLDRAVVEALYESIGAEGARSVIVLFIGESEAQLTTITAAAAHPLDAARRAAARRAAHSLKSAAGQLGAAALAAAAAEVERIAAGGEPVAEVATALAACAGDTHAALQRLLAPEG